MTTPDSYNGNPHIKRDGVQQSFTAHEISEYKKCMASVAYFTEHYVKVINLDRGLVNFKLRGYQEQMTEHFSNNRFSIVLACRQSGKCQHINTTVNIKNKITGEVKTITVGELYEMSQRNSQTNLCESELQSLSNGELS
jgi:hypothetical protein